MTTKVNEQLEQIVNIFSEVSGLEFTKSISTNSWYNHSLNIRISDHYSKYTEKKGTGSQDFVNPDLEFLVKILFKNEWFKRLHKNVELYHDYEKVGKIKYISHDEERGTVTVYKENEDRIVSYFYERINIL